MLDAYSIRKAAPRILLAVIGINLSIYLCLAAVDITNVIGHGLAGLLSGPFITADAYDFGVDDGIVTNATTVVGGAGIFVGAGALAASVGGIATLASAPLATLGMLLILMIPIALVALAIMITVVIRQALLIFLIIISPVAIACFVLPGTEKYFRQWLDIFVKTLLVYPIIAAIFAMSDVFGSIIFREAQDGSQLSGVVKVITGVIVVYAPLFLIPFAFRFAGGVMGRLAAVATTGAGKVANLGPIKGRRDIAKRDLHNRSVQHRADIAGRLKDYSSNNRRNWASRRLTRGLSGAIGGYNIEAQSSAVRGQMAKELNDQIATGRDEEIRGLTVNRAAADADYATRGDASELKRFRNGQEQYRTLGGAWVNAADVEAGHRRWGTDTYAQQAALSYEMRKAASDDEVEMIGKRYRTLATGDGGWRMTESQATGALIGAGFENQNQHLEFKHMDLDGNLRDGGEGFVKELYEKKGSYPMSSMSAHTAKQLSRVWEAEPEGSAQREQIKGIAETFMRRGAASPRMVGDGDDARPAPVDPAQGGGEGYASFGAQGSAHTNEAWRELARRTGVLGDGGPNNDYSTPEHPLDPPGPYYPGDHNNSNRGSSQSS